MRDFENRIPAIVHGREPNPLAVEAAPSRRARA